MAEKSFIVRKGLEVAETLIFTNDEINSVGIASTQPGGKLTVSGTIEGDGIRLVGFSTAERGIHLGVGGTVISAETNTQKVGINEASPSFPLEVKDPAGIGGTTLFVHGNVGVSTDLIVDETATIQRDLTVNRHCLVSAAGITTLASETKITGAISAHINATSSLAVGSTASFGGAVAFASSIGGPEGHIDDLTVRRNLHVNATGFSTIASDLSVTGNVTTHLGVTSSLSIGSTSDFTGAVSFASSIGGPEAHIDDLTVRRNLFVSSAGVGTIAADIAITGSVTEHLGVTSSLSIGSTSDFTGAISCASSITAATFFGDGNGLTNINPSEVNLDGTDQRLADLDVSGIGTVATLVVSGVSTFTGDITAGDMIAGPAASSGQISAPNHLGTGNTANIQVNSQTDANPSISLNHAKSDSLGSAYFAFNKASGDFTTPTIIGDSSTYGSLVFNGYDGSNYIRGAQIQVEMDGIAGVNSMPGRILFETTGINTSTPVERMRINSLGEVGIGTADPKVSLHVVGDTQISGFCSATNFLGDGSALTNISASEVDLDGTYQDFQGLTVAGVTTLTEGLRSVGFTTFLQKVHILDNVQLQIGGATEGATGDMRLYHDTSNSFIDDNGTGNLQLRTILGTGIDMIGGASTEYLSRFIKDGAVELYYDGSKILETLEDGIDVTGNVRGDLLNISGVGTISGGLTGNVTGNVTGDLTGTATNATKVNIEGLDATGNRAILFQGASGNAATTEGRVALASTTNYPRIQPSTGKITAAGGVVANLTGNVTGNLTGDVTGNVTGNVTGVSTGANKVKLFSLSGTATRQILFVSGSDSEYDQVEIDSDADQLTYAPDTNTFSVSNIVGNLTGDVTGTATTATLANTSTIVAGVTTSSFINFTDGGTGAQALKSDTSLRYTPTSQTLTTGTVVAALTGDVTGNVAGNLTGNVTGDVTGNADTATTASSSTNIQIDSGSTNADRLIVFADGTGSSQRAKADTDLTYNPSTNTLTAGTYDTSSDERIKKNINPIDDALEILSELNGVKFEWKENGLPSAGVIAQDVEKVLPELVHEVNEVKRVNYDGLIGVLIESVKTLAKRVEELENK